MSGDDPLDFLDSRSLIGFQLDASHLHNVLQLILRNQQATSQNITTISRRVVAVEQALQETQDRVVQIGGAVERLGGNGGDELRLLKSHVQDVTAIVDNLSRQAVPELRRSQDDLRRAVSPMERALQQLVQSVAPIEAATAQLQFKQEDIAKELQNVQRAAASQLATLQQFVEDIERDRRTETIRVAEVVREIQTRVERSERTAGPGASQLRDAIEELNQRTNDNFRQVELSSKAVDSELHRVRTDLTNMRTELNVVDNNGRQKMAKITEDMDAKFDMVLQLLQNFERSSTELEEHLAAAGKVLQSRAAAAGQQRVTTTTTTASVRGGSILSDVRRNVAGDLSDPRRGTNAW